jgi:hypothetical protein
MRVARPFILIAVTAWSGPVHAQGSIGDRAPHWSLRPLSEATPPATDKLSPNSIDAFIGARLLAAGLQQSPRANPTTLIRRLFLVMLGVPPSPTEVADYLADQRDDAFEHLVDKVLADERYGEHWARHWLDVVRFAESDGFETNHQRTNAWRFRDYVIEAFNNDTPYDQFVREQLAGDALGADIATGFLVAGQRDIVGSPDPVLTAQQRADQLDDIVATTSAAFLGMTVGCARCHSHKFDPISQRDYYALTAVFAGVHHGERDLPMPAGQAAKLARVEARIADLNHKLAPFRVLPPPGPESGAPLRPAVNYQRNEERFEAITAKFVRFTVFATTRGQPCIDELEVWSGSDNVALASHGAKATASSALPGYAIHKIKHLNDGVYGNSHSWISNEQGGGWAEIELAQPTQVDRIIWGRDRDGVVNDRLAVRYRIEVAQEPNEWHVVASSSDRQPSATPATANAATAYRFAKDNPASEQGRAWLAAIHELQSQRAPLTQQPRAYAGTFKQPGPTHLLRRGDPMQRAEPIEAGTLTLYQPEQWQDETPEQLRRLKLANWITDPRHPLPARVLVNRIWQQQFGAGIVSTPSDFGRNGAPPSHTDLLDWLAKDFIEHGWSIKSLQRLILTSATWQQASTPKAAALEVDANNRLLWRFPPRRLAAEAIRDCILCISGKLDHRRGGPSFSLHNVGSEYVRHYQPKEVFGPDESRRMVYAMKVRTEPDLVFTAFDCPDGSLTMPKRGLSTTPLQALNLWNSKFIQQQSAAMADRLVREAGDQAPAIVDRAWTLVFQREPEPGEATEAIALIEAAGLQSLCRALLNSNEFLFIP